MINNHNIDHMHTRRKLPLDRKKHNTVDMFVLHLTWKLKSMLYPGSLKNTLL